jgi:hypothetical protein
MKKKFNQALVVLVATSLLAGCQKPTPTENQNQVTEQAETNTYSILLITPRSYIQVIKQEFTMLLKLLLQGEMQNSLPPQQTTPFSQSLTSPMMSVFCIQAIKVVTKLHTYSCVTQMGLQKT